MRTMIGALGLAAALALSAGAAGAATVTFNDAAPGGPGDGYIEDGLSFDYARIVSGNCDSASGAPCLALNDNETSVVTATAGGTFSLSSFWYQLLGAGNVNTLTVTTDLGGTLTFDSDTDGFNDGGAYVDLTSNALFQGITSLTFSKSGGGNVRIDDLLAIAAIPLPAAGWLLLAGLGGLAGWRGRRSRA